MYLNLDLLYNIKKYSDNLILRFFYIDRTIDICFWIINIINRNNLYSENQYICGQETVKSLKDFEKSAKMYGYKEISEFEFKSKIKSIEKYKLGKREINFLSK